MTIDATYRRLDWDSGHFGFRIGRIDAAEPGDLAPALRLAAADGARMLIARCDTAAVPLIHALENAGFLLMTTSAHYRCVLRHVAGPAEGVRLLAPGQIEDVARIAASAFRGFFGHFHADPRLDREKCDQLYVEWSRNSCTEARLADAVLIAHDHAGRACAFLTLKRTGEGGAEAVLVAVDVAAQGRGLSQTMLAGAKRWCSEHGIGRLEVASQLANFPAQRAWERAGFEIDAAWNTFHLWVDKNANVT